MLWSRRYFHIKENAKIAAKIAIFKRIKPREDDIPLPSQEADKSGLCGSVGHIGPKGSASAYFPKTVDFLSDIGYNRGNISAKEEICQH